MLARMLFAAALVAAPATARGKPAAVPGKVKPPPPPCVVAPIDLALIPRVSLNARRRPCARNYLGLALGAGRAGELRGLEIAVGANMVDRDAVGVQLSLGLNAAGGDSTGAQLTGLLNAAGGNFTGLQFAGLLNASGGDTEALQIAGIGNATGGGVIGLQLAGVFNAAGGDARAIQLAGLFNAAGGNARGLQASGLFNAAGGDARGLQASGLFNAVGGRATGVQLSGLFSAASRLRGLQASGAANAVAWGEGMQIALGYNRAQRQLAGVQIAAVNIGCNITGAQIGIVNIAGRVRGVQLGLVNIAEQADAPIGLVSWTRGGDRAVEVWGGEALAVAGVRLGNGRVYSLLGLGSGPLVDGSPWGPAGGAGVMGHLGPVTILGDLLAHALFFDGIDDQAALLQGRARGAIDLSPRVAVSLGATWNLFLSRDVAGADLPLGPDTARRSGDTLMRQWPGLTAGAALRL